MDAREIIEKFGGQSALAALIDKGQSTVAYWAKTGVIPARWQPRLMILAMQHGIPLTAQDLVNEPPLKSPNIDGSVVSSRPQQLPEGRVAAFSSPAALPPSNNREVVAFKADDGDIHFRFDGSTQDIWASQEQMAKLFSIDQPSISRHINNIFKDGELDEQSNMQKVHIANVDKPTSFYSLDVVISVGYRVNSRVATKFRQWATQTLRAYVEQGYVVNEKVLRDSPEKLNRLAAQIRALRSEEKQVYAKVRECFKISSSDYDPESKHVKSFYARLQDKFHHAVTGMTASKLVMDRADHTVENMGLRSMKGLTPTLADAETGKNYLREDELYRLHLLSEQFLLFAESTALAGQKMTMESLHLQLDRLLTLNNYPVFDGYKDFIKNEAMQHARLEYNLYKKRLKIESMGIPYNEEDLAAGLYDDLLIQ